MMKVWKDIPGYEGLYQVSNYGDVISIPRNGTVKYIREKSQMTDKDGYKIVKLRKNNNPKMVKVHRLVALSFLETIKDKNVVDHINGKRSDNRVSNLRWVNIRENNLSRRIYRPILEVKQFKNGIFINKFDSLRQAERETGFSYYKISKNLVEGFEFILQSSTTRGN